VSGLGAIKEGTKLEEYDTKHSRLGIVGWTTLGVTSGTMMVAGLGYAAYLKYFKPKPKTFTQKVKDKLRRK